MRLYRSKLILVALAFLAVSQVEAQQQPFYSQYMLDKFLVNPAVAGASGITTVNFVSRQQYMGLVNAPQTFALTAQGRFLDESYIMKRLRPNMKEKRKSRSGRVGMGGSIYTDRNGIISRTGFQATYGYHLTFRNRWQFSGGISLLGYQLRIDDEGVPIEDPDDPLLAYNKKSFFVPDANIGFLVTNGDFYGGITVNDLLASNLKLGKEVYAEYEMLRKYNIIAGYKINLSSNLGLEPSILIQGTSTNFSLDMNARLMYMDNYWLGLSYRSNKSMVVMLGARIDRFFLGYAYDLDIGLVRSYTSGSHEVIFGLRIGDNSTRRIRWFKQDERNFDI